MDDKHAHDIKKHLKVYIGVFVALLVGTIITVAASRVNLGHAGSKRPAAMRLVNPASA